jgi:hypothetical protein
MGAPDGPGRWAAWRMDKKMEPITDCQKCDIVNEGLGVKLCLVHGAAPDLLSALKRMVEENEPALENSPRRAGWLAAKAVIAFAEGS